MATQKRLRDRVAESSTSTGTGDMTLSGAVLGYLSLSGAGYSSGDSFPYQIVAVDSSGNPSGQWESGFTTYNGSAIARSSVNVFGGSSGENTLVNFSAGTKHIGIGVIADHMDSLVLPNKLYNGCFQVDQRYEGSSMALATMSGITNYGADQWACWKGSGASTNSTGQRLSTSPPTGFLYYYKFGRDSGQTGTAKLNLGQALETGDSIDMAGGYATFSFWYKAGSGFSGTTLTASINKGTGTDGSMAAMAAQTWTGFSQYSKSLTPTTTWQQGFVSTSFASSDRQIGVQFEWTPAGTAGSNDHIEIAGCNLTSGRIPLRIVQLPFGEDLRRCERFFCKSAEPGTLASAQNFYSMHTMYCGANGSGAIGTSVRFPVVMRANPTITFYDLASPPNSGKVTKITNSGGSNSSTNNTTPTNIQSTAKGFNLEIAGAANNCGIEFNWKAEAPL